MCTSSGSQPTTFVVSRTVGVLVQGDDRRSRTAAGTPGDHGWALTVKPTTVARPDTTVGCHARLRHFGQIGTGGCTSVPQSVQPWMRRRPSAPDVQNHWSPA